MPTETKPENSFGMDQIKMAVPRIRPAGSSTGKKGDTVSKYEIWMVSPNRECLPPAVIHTLEHCLAVYLREHLEGIIDLSPMGCRTGFYLTVWDSFDTQKIENALIESLKKVMKTDWGDIPGAVEEECGNYRDHSLYGARKYAKQIIEGFYSKKSD